MVDMRIVLKFYTESGDLKQILFGSNYLIGKCIYLELAIVAGRNEVNWPEVFCVSHMYIFCYFPVVYRCWNYSYFCC